METLTISPIKKNYINALDVLGTVYSFYRSNQPVEIHNTGQTSQLFFTLGNTIGYPIYKKDFLDSLQSVAVFIMPEETITTECASQESCKISISSAIDKFCKENGLERALKTYKNILCSIFKDASVIVSSLSEDPEIGNQVKISFDIKIKSDIHSLLQMDKDFFEAVNSVIPDNEKDFFVKTYSIE